MSINIESHIACSLLPFNVSTHYVKIIDKSPCFPCSQLFLLIKTGLQLQPSRRAIALFSSPPVCSADSRNDKETKQVYSLYVSIHTCIISGVLPLFLFSSTHGCAPLCCCVSLPFCPFPASWESSIRVRGCGAAGGRGFNWEGGYRERRCKIRIFISPRGSFEPGFPSPVGRIWAVAGRGWRGMGVNRDRMCLRAVTYSSHSIKLNWISLRLRKCWRSSEGPISLGVPAEGFSK